VDALRSLSRLKDVNPQAPGSPASPVLPHGCIVGLSSPPPLGSSGSNGPPPARRRSVGGSTPGPSRGDGEIASFDSGRRAPKKADRVLMSHCRDVIDELSGPTRELRRASPTQSAAFGPLHDRPSAMAR